MRALFCTSLCRGSRLISAVSMWDRKIQDVQAGSEGKAGARLGTRDGASPRNRFETRCSLRHAARVGSASAAPLRARAAVLGSRRSPNRLGGLTHRGGDTIRSQWLEAPKLPERALAPRIANCRAPPDCPARVVRELTNGRKPRAQHAQGTAKRRDQQPHATGPNTLHAKFGTVIVHVSRRLQPYIIVYYSRYSQWSLTTLH